MQMRLDLVNLWLRQEMGAEYSSMLAGYVILCMQTAWKWATHTEDGVGRKTPVSRFWSGTLSQVPLHSQTSLLEAVFRLCCQIRWWVYVSTRYMKVSHNEWGALTWLLIHSNEMCSHGAYTRNEWTKRVWEKYSLETSWNRCIIFNGCTIQKNLHNIWIAAC